MKNQNKIINNDLKTLLEKFSNTDVIPTIEQNYARESIVNIPLNEIEDNQFLKKARISESNLSEYKEYILDNGFIRPLVVRHVKDHYEIVIGRRLFIACKILKIKEIPVIIANFNDEETLLVLLVDTLEQKSYNVVEVAYLINNLRNSFNYKNKDLSKLLKQSTSQVSNILQLLNLPREILKDVVNEKLSYGHAKAISRLSESEAINIKNEIYKNKLSVRETEDLVRSKTKNDDLKVSLKKNKIVITSQNERLLEDLYHKILDLDIKDK